METQLVIQSPLGEMLVCERQGAIVGIYFIPQKYGRTPDPAKLGVSPLLLEAKKSLTAYFQGTLSTFDLPLALEGTDFQKIVWAQLLAIPFGETWSYQQLADRCGKSSGVRAVANAVGKNPISLVVPCHRVIGSNGALTGYAGGVDRKAALLALENNRPFQMDWMNP
ncbi:methylated-DNA--[protein]-cysteine S-methyltransferase [Leeia sp. TBRC 13508]|uniref:Methylated-DNA--protein-cysteine methyltransferase n=1 Tax=Leeia speluncae TaxID=2884804 RepID=A0ABS8D4H1_9NEIS|nr:methylated-DNA--[protein]-cysteine S-methyltransferase [Leeia speluncae]MCB6183114.1 methylated-DNA--[protein]-cysteine S-methyltransferase [Leeia speluncae]